MNHICKYLIQEGGNDEGHSNKKMDLSDSGMASYKGTCFSHASTLGRISVDVQTPILTQVECRSGRVCLKIVCPKIHWFIIGLSG